MTRSIPTLVLCAAVSSCGADSEAPYRFVEAATACETAEWARTRAELLESGDTAEADRYASARCFRVESQRRVSIADSEGGFPGGIGRWVEVVTVDGAPLEHHASAELRRTLGQAVRTRGWVAGAVLEEVE